MNKSRKPGSLYMTISVSLAIDSGLSMGVWEREIPLPSKAITLTKQEWNDAALFSPKIRQVLIDSGLTPWLEP